MADVPNSEIARLMDQACKEIMKPFSEPIREIYIDTDFLYDYRLGALLLKLKTDAEYKYVLDHIQEYIDGPSPKITSYFPDLGITEEDLDLLESDPAYKTFIHVAAPGTRFLMDLAVDVIRINTQNRTKDNVAPLKIILNQRKHLMPDKIRQRITDFIHELDKHAKIIFTNFESWTSVPDEVFSKIKVLFVYDLIDFCKYGSTSAAAMRRDKVLDKTVIANFVTEDDFSTHEEHVDAINKFLAVMTTLFDTFRFIKKSVLIER